MFYILENGIRVKKWASGWACCGTEEAKKPFPLRPKDYKLLKSCDGMTDLADSDALRAWEAMGVIRKCEKGEAQLSEGQIQEYPNKLNCVLDWTITDRCNYNCLHCFHAADNTTLKDEFSREEAFHLLKEAQACGITHVELTGGEPTMYPYFRDVVQEVHDLGMKLGCVVTNGSLMTEELAAFIKRLHPDCLIAISFDGIGIHDWMRQHKGSEESAKNAIRICVAAGLKVVSNMNVNRKNRDVLFDSVKMLSEMGVDHLRIIKTTEVPRWALNSEDFSMTPEEYYDYSIEFAKQYRESGLTIPVRLWQVLALNGRDKIYHIVPVKASGSTFCEYEMICPDMLKKLSVQPSGEIIPCAPMAGILTSRNIHLGNVKHDGLVKLLSEGALYEQVTYTVKDKQKANSKCAGCKYFKYCQGGCPAVGLLFNGSPLGTDDYKCMFFEKGYYKKISEAMEGWKNLLPLTEAEERLLSGES
ncbi:radical SAM/SPASM domain-containing protein [Oribacterium sp. P6A1]|uniref:radical SAM/SPASM domain-containing protein n=1 Tax=Oribacterium sp. P6A1 TaxID=1410612 RepID=UPI0005628BE2|nr:radical SAM protein [Oribacterium sp. P6A1]